MRDDLADDFMELTETEVARVQTVQQCETELVLLVLFAVDKCVHDGRELRKRNVLVPVLVHHVEYPVGKERIRLQSEQPHALPELVLGHLPHVMHA